MDRLLVRGKIEKCGLSVEYERYMTVNRNDTKGTNKSFVELNLINYCEIPWNELTNILYKSCVQYIEFLLDTEGILDGEEYTELLSGFGRFAEMYSIYQT